jgi:hypothetical protein
MSTVPATHIRVTCSSCRAIAEVCGRCSAPLDARSSAVETFADHGWQREGAPDGRAKWLCPKCARHL